jgi:hypothetical protein
MLDEVGHRLHYRHPDRIAVRTERVLREASLRRWAEAEERHRRAVWAAECRERDTAAERRARLEAAEAFLQWPVKAQALSIAWAIPLWPGDLVRRLARHAARVADEMETAGL